MSPRTRARQGVAALLAAGLLLLPGVPAAASPGAGSAAIRGVVYRMDEATRLAGTLVTAINVSTGRRYLSNYTGDNGAYEIADLPAGTYDIAIEAQDQKVYVSDNLVDLADQQHLYLSFSLKPKGGGARAGSEGTPSSEGPGQAQVTFTDPNAIPTPEPAARPAKKRGFWRSPGGAAILGLLVAGAVGAGVAAQRGN